MCDLGLGDRALGILRRALNVGMIGGQNRRRCADHGADFIVHLLGLGLVDDAAVEGGAGRGVVQALETLGLGHVRVLVEVVVVIG